MVNETTPFDSTALSAILLQSAGALNGAPAPAGSSADAKVADFSALLNLAGDNGAAVPKTPAAVPALAVPALVPSTPAERTAAPATTGKPTGKTLPLADQVLPEAAPTELPAEPRDAPEQALADAAMIVEAVTSTFPLTSPIVTVNHIAAPQPASVPVTPQPNNTTVHSPRGEVKLTANPTAVPIRATAAAPVQTPPRPAAMEAVSRATRAATLLSPGVAAAKFTAIEIVPSNEAQAAQPLSAPASMPAAANTVAGPSAVVAARGLTTASESVAAPVLPQLAARPAPAPQAGAIPAAVEAGRNATSDFPAAPIASHPTVEASPSSSVPAVQPARPQPAVTLMPTVHSAVVANAPGIAAESKVSLATIAPAPAHLTSALCRTVRAKETDGKAQIGANTTTATSTDVSSLATPLPPTTASAILPEMRPAAPAPASAPPLPASAPLAHDFAALVDRIAEARESGSGNLVRTTIRHADFGPVAMQFRADEGLTSVTFSSSDPAFAPAVQAAAATVMASQAGDQERREQQPRHEQQFSGQNPQQQQSATSQTGTGSQPSPQQSAQDRAEAEARAFARGSDRGRPSQQSDRDQADRKPERRSGIYA